MPDKLTDSEKKKIKQENKAKANPELAAGKKEKSDAKRERRKVHCPRHCTLFVPSFPSLSELTVSPTLTCRAVARRPSPPPSSHLSPWQESGSTKSFA